MPASECVSEIQSLVMLFHDDLCIPEVSQKTVAIPTKAELDISSSILTRLMKLDCRINTPRVSRDQVQILATNGRVHQLSDKPPINQ